MSSHTTFVLAASLGVSLYLATVSGAGATMHGQPGEPPSGTEESKIEPEMMGEGLKMPSMDPARGRKLFASKGCVVCHSVNGVGGEDAPPLDATTMERRMNPFEFAAKMWRGAEAMIYLQREELGEQIDLTGEELSDIIAFSHSLEEQRKFSMDDVPPTIQRAMHHMEEEMHEGADEEHEEEEGAHGADKPKE